MELNERNIEMLENLKFPNTYWKGKSRGYRYWFRSLLQKIDSSLIFTGIPENWSNDFFMLCLWAFGFVSVFKTDRGDLEKYGPKVLFQPCTISGFDFYYQPEKCLVSNPKYNKQLTIGKDAELLKLTPDFMGVFDIIDYYATKLAEISKGIDMGLINAKMPMILSASNEAQSETLKKIYDKVQAGESLVVYKDTNDDQKEIMPTKEAFEVWNQDFKQTYIVHNLLEDMQIILDSFYVEIGLPVAIEKKERLVTSEADFASAQSQARISCWVETLRESFARIEKTFGIKLEVEYAAKKDDSDRNGDVSESERNTSKYKR